MAATRIVIVGTGPAGVRAAQTLVRANLRPIVIDEGEASGGRIHARQPTGFRRSASALYGPDAVAARSLHDGFDALRDAIDYRPRTQAWNLVPGRLYVEHAARSETLEYDALIVCAGATDRLMPVPGWNLAGNFSLGGAQLALKTQACAIGRRVAFVGTGPLLYLVAAQYAKAGAGVAGVFDTSPWRARLAALPELAAGARLLLRGLALELALRRAGVPVRRGIEPLQVEGSGEDGVSGFTWRQPDGATRHVDCDAVALGYHLRPESQLADLARCEFTYEPRTRQWLPRVDADGRSSVPRLYLAGDGVRVLGAAAAECSGELAAQAALHDLGLRADEARMQQLRARLAQHARFAGGLATAFPWPAANAARLPDATVVCRCESISAGELRRACDAAGAQESNRAKAFTRIGMGRCQGRYCGDAAAEILAATAGSSHESVGRLRAQAPVKPLPAGTRASPGQ